MLWFRPPSGGLWLSSSSLCKSTKKTWLKFPVLGFASSPGWHWDMDTGKRWHLLQHRCRTWHCGNIYLPRKPGFPSLKQEHELSGTWGTSQTSALCSSYKDQFIPDQRFLKQNASLFDSSHPKDGKCKNPKFWCFSEALIKDTSAGGVI